MNNTYKITVSSPLLRPGLTIETECSEKYLVAVLKKVMDSVREINTEQPKKVVGKFTDAQRNAETTLRSLEIPCQATD
jgi:hypothetical protein